MNDAVALQLEITARVPRGYRLTQELLDSVVREWAEDGVSPDGIKIEIIDWSRANKSGKPPRHFADQEAARKRFRGLLRAGRFTVRLRNN